MSHPREIDRKDRLGRILREGDPALLEPGLSAEEIHALRRTVLTALPEPRRRLAWFPYSVAAGASVALALALAVALLPDRHPVAPSRPVPPPRVAAVPAPERTVPPPAPALSLETRPEKPVREPLRKSTRVRRTAPVRPEVVASIPEAPSPEVPGTVVREIQFSTPGGTRIIWVLPSDSTL